MFEVGSWGYLYFVGKPNLSRSNTVLTDCIYRSRHLHEDDITVPTVVSVSSIVDILFLLWLACGKKPFYSTAYSTGRRSIVI